MRRALILVCGIAIACGGGGYGGGGTPPGPSPNPSPYTITIAANRVDPSQLMVPAGSQVTFRNQDTRPHDMNSDPHPDHEDCPDLNVGLLAPGQSRQSRNLVTPGTCGFHDHLDPDRPTLKGRIIIQ